MRDSADRPPSKQEFGVLVLLARGLTNDEIGRQLGVTEATVKKHVTSLLRKFAAANRAELAATATRAGLLGTD